MKKSGEKAAYNIALCRTSAKELLRSLGVSLTMIPKTFGADGKLADWNAIDRDKERASEFHPRSNEAKAVPKRFKRTRREMEQLRQFTEWQKAQRNVSK